MSPLKDLDNLPEAQQKVLSVILYLKKPSFRTSEVVPKMDDKVNAQSVGGVLGSLFRNGFLQRLQGGRDKLWKLSEEAEQTRSKVEQQLGKVKKYWS